VVSISTKKLILWIIYLGAILSGCTGLTSFVNNSVYEHALVETQINGNNWKIVFSGREVSMQKAIDFSLLKAGELSLDNGYKYFEIIDQEKSVNSYTVTKPAWNVKNKNGTYTHYPGSSRQVNKPIIETRIFMHNDNSLVNNNTFESELIILSLSSSYLIDSIAAKKAEKNRQWEEERKKLEALRLAEEERQKQTMIQREPPPQTLKGIRSVYSGTGFLFSSKDYVITNWHVVRGANNINIKFINGEKIEAKVVLKEPKNDIAFLKLLRQPQLPPSNLKIGDSSHMKMGDKVFTIGYPAHFVMGDNPKYSEGVVNSITGLKDDPTVFQISVQIQPGNSGGPLFNSSGEVIGITQSSLDPNLAIEVFGGILPQNVNYAIKSSFITALLPMLPETLIASRGIVVIPSGFENTLANFIEKAKRNIVLIESK
jgi:S1-C subfamily serine protease